MRKATCLTLGVSLLLAMTPHLVAQINPTQAASAAEEEALRRQETMTLLNANLTKAKSLQKTDKLAAANLYEQCLRQVRQLGGVGVEAQNKDAIAGLVNVRIKRAYEFQDEMKYKEAAAEADQVLKFDPQNKAALEFKKFNVTVEQGRRGKSPTKDTLAKIPLTRQQQITVQELVHDGQLLYELRRLDEADEKLKEAVRLDPQSDSAYYFLKLILDVRFDEELRKRELTYDDRLIEVEKKWNEQLKNKKLQIPNMYLRTNIVHTSAGRQAIIAKLDAMVLSEAVFDGLPLSEVIKFLSDEAKKQDKGADGKEGTGINFMINSQITDILPTPTGAGGLGGAAGGGPGVGCHGPAGAGGSSGSGGQNGFGAGNHQDQSAAAQPDVLADAGCHHQSGGQAH